MIKKKIYEFETNVASEAKNNPKILFSYVKSKQVVKDQIRLLHSKDGNALTEMQDIANELNNHFSSVFAADTDSTNPRLQTRINTSCGQISESMLSDELIKKRLHRIDGNKSSGPDGVHPLILKHCAESLATPLSIIFNKSASDATIPRQWKIANVTPLFKKGNRSDAGNYRPVSLTSIPCKIMESIIRDHICAYLNDKGYITNKQHGFVPRKSCATNLLESQDFITKCFAQKKCLDVFYADFEKAFDRVSHPKLLFKLKEIGITGKLLEWLSDFLIGRSQRVVMGDIVSEFKPVTSGVPQGSVLGPTLFIVFINDLPDNLGHCLLYADDTKIFKILRDLSDNSLQDEIDALQKWCTSWKMSLNCKKCKVMHFGKRNPKHTYFLSDPATGKVVNVEKTSDERDLGVIISSNGKFNTHTEKMASKANRILGMMLNTFENFDSKIAKIIYPTFVRPHLEFAAPVWNPRFNKSIALVEKVQRRALRSINGFRSLDYNARLRKIGISNLEKRRTRGDLIQQFKFSRELERVDWPFFVSTTTNTLSLRSHKQQINREISSNSNRHHFFMNRVSKPWNRLPQEIVEARSLNAFKAKLDNWL